MRSGYSSFFIILLAFIVAVSLAGNLTAAEKKADKHPDVDFSISCVECHTEVTPKAVQEWKSSKHGMMNFGCYMCHGDGQEDFAARPGSDRCIACHSGQEVDFSKTPVKNCFDCHQGHTLKFHQGD